MRLPRPELVRAQELLKSVTGELAGRGLPRFRLGSAASLWLSRGPRGSCFEILRFLSCSEPCRPLR